MNLGGGASSANYSIDTKKPAVTSSTIADNNLAAGESTTVTIIFSEKIDPNSFTLDGANPSLQIVTYDRSFGVSRGTLSNLRTIDDGITWQVTLTGPTSGSTFYNALAVDHHGITDLAGNQGRGGFAGERWEVLSRFIYQTDAEPPTTTITLADTALTAGETTTVTFTFSEPVTGFTADDIVLSNANGTLGTLTANADRTVWTATFTPTAKVNDITNTISVNLTGVTDDAGNAGVGSASSANYTVNTGSADTTAPTATITLADTALTVGETTTVTFTFSEPVTGFTADDIVLSNANGTLGTLTANTDRTVWSATFTPTANVNDATNTISVNLTGVSDDAGNAGVGSATSANYTIDTAVLRPRATITLADTALKAGETTTVTFTFNERVNGFTADDIVLTDANGTLGALTPVGTDGTTWTATFTPTADIEDSSNTIGVNLAGVTNTAGNAGVGNASSAPYSIDTKKPTVTSFTIADNNLAAGESTTVTITFSEKIDSNSFTLDGADPDLSIVIHQGGFLPVPQSRGTLSNLRTIDDGTTWQVTLTGPTTGSTRGNYLWLNLYAITDLAGNPGSGGNHNRPGATDSDARGGVYGSGWYATDAEPPTATITLADSALTAGETTTVTFTFSESVTGFTADDIVLSNANGTLGPLTANADRTVWTATFTPTAKVNDITNTISVNLTGVTDDAGNAGVGSASSANYTVDTRLAATITLADSTLTVGETTTVAFTFSESVNGFTADDIGLSNANGTLGILTPNAARTVWIATFTPAANVNDATNTISVNLTGVTDDADNAGVGSASSANFTIDTAVLRPRATITLADTALKVGETTTVTFTFNERVNGFTADDIVLTDANGTLGALTPVGTDGTTWTATFTPTADIEDVSNTIGVNLAGVTNTAGNAGMGNASSANYTVNTGSADTTAPTATITLVDTALTVGETTTVTFTFSEPVTGFTADDIVLSNANGTLGTLTANAARTVWTAAFTPTANVNDATNTISVNMTGVTDDAGNAGTGTATSANFTIDTRPADTTAPTATITLADSTLTAGETTTVTFTFSKPVTGLTLEDIDLTQAKGLLSAPVSTDGGRTWRATFTPTADLDNTTGTILLNLGGVTDDAANAGIGHASSGNYTVDTQAPVLTGATVNANQLVLSYTEGTTLDATHGAPASAFTVKVDGVAKNVTAVIVDAGAKTITLVLGTSVTHGQTVHVTYTDPTAGNDANAVQDVAGNDAASFNARAVDNLAPAPVPVAPPTITTPNPPDTDKDTDKDGIPSATENQVPGITRPDGTASVVGDGNGDGIQDSTQTAVVSTSVVISPRAESNPATAPSSPVTLVAGSQDGKLHPDSNAQVTSLVQKDAPAGLPGGLEMPIGLLRFNATLTEGRSSETFSLYVDPALGVNGYWVQDNAGVWVNLASEPYGGKMQTEGGKLRLDFRITDGGQFDADG